ncbi:MAG: leucine-rich repeat protein [Eubacteriales bacterium]|nr:leucine-rich repeat protein [Eubacteriales bacterium]
MIFLYEQGEQGIRISRVFGIGESVEIPEKIQGYPVTELGAYAFSDRMDRKEFEGILASGKLCRDDGIPADSVEGIPEMAGDVLQEVCLPEHLAKIGRYAFYNCRNLRKIRVGSELSDLGAGALTGCHRIERVEAKLREDGSSCLRELLTELPEELRVDLRKNGETGRFWFPEFFEEGVENTPARILENHVHGSGIRYRNCFSHKSLNIKEYDKLFAYARAWEQESAVARLAADRVLYPMELSESAKEQYVNFLKEHILPAVSYLAQKKEYSAMGKILEEILPGREDLDEMLVWSEREGDMECVSLLMDHLHRHTKMRRKVFEL